MFNYRENPEIYGLKDKPEDEEYFFNPLEQPSKNYKFGALIFWSIFGFFLGAAVFGMLLLYWFLLKIYD